MTDVLLKTRRYNPDRQVEVLARLDLIRRNAPPGIPALLKWGLGPEIGQIWIWERRIIGRPWFACTDIPRSTRSQALLDLLRLWKKAGFVHGDLSPRNLIWDGSTQKCAACDWILDLRSHQGTPAFAPNGVFRGRHDFNTDLKTGQRIIAGLARAQ